MEYGDCAAMVMQHRAEWRSDERRWLMLRILVCIAAIENAQTVSDAIPTLGGASDAVAWLYKLVSERNEHRRLLRNPQDNVDNGTLTDIHPLNTWIEVASFVDDDDIAFSEERLTDRRGMLA